jgi:hypothetical protein
VFAILHVLFPFCASFADLTFALLLASVVSTTSSQPSSSDKDVKTRIDAITGKLAELNKEIVALEAEAKFYLTEKLYDLLLETKKQLTIAKSKQADLEKDHAMLTYAPSSTSSTSSGKSLFFGTVGKNSLF